MEPQDTAESISKAGDASENIFKKGQNATQRRKKKVQDGSVNIKDRKGEEAGASGAGAAFPFQLVERTMPEQGKSGRGNEWQKETTVY